MEIITELNAVTLLKEQAQAEKQKPKKPKGVELPTIYTGGQPVIEFSIPVETWQRKWSHEIRSYILQCYGYGAYYAGHYNATVGGLHGHMRIELLESEYYELLKRLDGYYLELIEQIGHA